MNEAKIDLNNLDKSNWKTYRFDKIAKNISERVDPNNTDLKVYIGLEHIDSESLHIKRHGTPDDVNGTKLKFYKGDIIFGRRRAYQRKAGIATTDGFCSAHALVLRANPDVITPELFPFFLHSDLFMNLAIDISVGSLSPTINWGTLKHQEFLLPPIDQQKKMAELLWSMNLSLQKDSELLDKLNDYSKTCIIDLFETYSKECKEETPISHLYKTKLKSVDPITLGNSEVYHYSLPAFLETKSPEVVFADTIKSNKLLISESVLLFSKLNPNNPKVWAVDYDDKKTKVGSTEWLPVIPNEIFTISYLNAYFSSQYFIGQVMRFVQGTSNSHKRIDPKKFYSLKIPVLNSKYRNNIAHINNKLLQNKQQLSCKIDKAFTLYKTIINQVC